MIQILNVTRPEAARIYRLASDCTRGPMGMPGSLDEGCWREGLTEILGEEVVDQLLFRENRIVVHRELGDLPRVQLLTPVPPRDPGLTPPEPIQ